MKKYLITGGAGFIGTHLSGALLKFGHKVIVIDNFSTSKGKNNDSGIKIYKTDIDDIGAIGKIFGKESPDAVIHLAGAINLRRNMADPLFKKDLDVLQRTENILDLCKKTKVKRFVFVSSGGAIYENAGVIPTPENYPASPSSLYALANLIIEKYIEIYCKNYNLDFTIARLSNVYGPGQWESGIIPSIIIKILKNESPVIYGTGKQTRDFIYIDDAVEALIMLAEKSKNGIYNIGTGKEISLNKVFETAKFFLGSKIKPIYKNLIIKESERSAMDIKKIKKELGWKPKTDFEKGLAKTIESFK